MAANLVEYILKIETGGAQQNLIHITVETKKAGKELDKTEKKAVSAGQKMRKSFNKTFVMLLG